MRPSIGSVVGLASLLFLAGCGGKTDGAGVTDGGPDGGGPGPTSDGGPDVSTACTQPSDCHLTSRTCCGVCGAPTASDVVSTTDVAGYHAAVCAAESGGGPSTCAGCAGRSTADLQPTCTAGRCAVLDVDADPISACAVDADCVLRAGTCCGACGAIEPWMVVAIHKDSEVAYRALVCAASEACPKCAGSFPSGMTALCDAATKHCVPSGVAF